LLVADVLVAGEQHVESFALRGIQQRPILQPLPSQFIRSDDLMSP